MKESKQNIAQLIARIQAGDEDAFEEVYLYFHRRLCVYILNFTADRSIAEDVAQETLFKFWKSRRKLRPDTNPGALLYRIAYNEFVDVHRKNKWTSPLLETARLESIADLVDDENELFVQRYEQVKKAIDALPPRSREVFILSKQHGLRYKDIAEKLNISIKTVEVHMGKAYKLIRQKVLGKNIK